MLLPILEFFGERRLLSKSDICNHFDLESSALEPILQKLIDTGKIVHLQPECTSCQSDCGTCSFAADMDIYRLLEK